MSRKGNGKRLAIHVVALSIMLGNLITYSLLNISFGNDDIGWMVWSFSHYFTLFAVIATIGNITSGLKRNRKTVMRIIMIAVSVVTLILGFYISTFKSYDAGFVLSCVLYGVAVVSLYVFGVVCVKIDMEKLDANADSQGGERDIEEDYFLFYTKRLMDEEGKKGVKIGYALIALLFVYVGLLVFIIYSNVVCDSVRIRDIVVVCVVAAIVISANQTQICLTAKNKIISTLIENGALVVALTLYEIVEWIFLPVTFNFILVILFLLLLIPIHIKFGALSKAYYKIYRRG